MTEEQRQKKLKNYEKALASLEEARLAFSKDQKDRVIRAGLIQNFEFCLELGWKLLKIHLEDSGEKEAFSPKMVVRKASDIGFLKEAELWLQMLADRNDSSHNYDESKAKDIAEKILGPYGLELHSLYEKFKTTDA